MVFRRLLSRTGLGTELLLFSGPSLRVGHEDPQKAIWWKITKYGVGKGDTPQEVVLLTLNNKRVIYRKKEITRVLFKRS
jgi:hypothetical protein